MILNILLRILMKKSLAATNLRAKMSEAIYFGHYTRPLQIAMHATRHSTKEINTGVFYINLDCKYIIQKAVRTSMTVP